jgi:MFS family permease
MRPSSRCSTFVLKYYCYMATLSAGFVYPITTQYKLWRGLSYADVGTVGAVFMGTWVLAEIPTGYLGDRFGRRTMLIASSGLNAAVMVVLALSTSLLSFAVGTFGWAVAFSMRSGVGSAWLYDLLRDRLDEGEYARVKGVGVAVMLGVTAIAALVGGTLAQVDWTYPYLVNAIWFALGVLVLLTLPATDEDDVELVTPRAAAGAVRAVVTKPPLRSFVRYFAAFYAFLEMVDLYVQPVATAIGFGRADLGLLYAGFYAVAALISINAGRIESLVGVRTWFLVVPFVVAAAFAAIAVLPVFALPAFFVLKVANRTSGPLMQQYVNDNIDTDGRATGISAVTMVAGIATVGTRTAAGAVADAIGPVATLPVFAVALAIVLGALLLTDPPIPVDDRDADTGELATASD